MPNPTADIFDMDLRSLRRDRAFHSGAELFLYERAFDDCLGRITLVSRAFHSALLLGSPDRGWPDRLRPLVGSLEAADPGPLFAAAAGGRWLIEDRSDLAPRSYDLIVAVGTLDTVNDLPRALKSLRGSLREDSLLIGAIAGGDGLPQLRRAMHAADQVLGRSSPHVHPRIEAASLAPLMAACGFTMPVIDVDRVQVSYASLAKLVADLRRMGATNILKMRDRQALSRPAGAAAEAAFRAAGDGSRTVETFEILHFAAWTPAA